MIPSLGFFVDILGQFIKNGMKGFPAWIFLPHIQMSLFFQITDWFIASLKQQGNAVIDFGNHKGTRCLNIFPRTAAKTHSDHNEIHFSFDLLQCR